MVQINNSNAPISAIWKLIFLEYSASLWCFHNSGVVYLCHDSLTYSQLSINQSRFIKLQVTKEL